MSIKYGDSKKQYVQGRRVKNLEVFLDREVVKVEFEEYDKTEPQYYDTYGLSPLEAFEEGLISKEEYVGFIKGNIIKYVVRCDKKENPIKDLEKARDYLNHLLNTYRDDNKFFKDLFMDYYDEHKW